MNKEDIVKYCLEFPHTYEDHPFKNDNFSIVMKHTKNNKWFLLIMNVNNKLWRKKDTFRVFYNLIGDQYGIRIRDCCRERAVC